MDPNPFSRGPAPHWESASQKRLRAANAGLLIPAVTLLHFSCGVLGVPPSHPLIALRLLVAAVISAPCRAVPGPSPVGESSISFQVSLNVLLKTTHPGCTPLVGGPQPRAGYGSMSQGPLGRGVCRPVSPGATQPYFGFESS